MTREITMLPAYDKRNKDPRKNYGIHGCDMLWILKGRRGAVEFLVYTGWQLKHVGDTEPSGAYVGYHSPTQRHEGQACNDCTLVEGGKCYSDRGYLYAAEVFDILRREGSDGVWRELEEFYTGIFGSLE